MQSEQKLKDSFIALMQSVDPSEITVKELCAAAGLNRSTFYERFGYMDHLIECLIGDCLDEVCAIHDDSKALGNHKKRVSRNDIREYIGRFQSNTVLMKFCKSKVKEKYFTTL